MVAPMDVFNYPEGISKTHCLSNIVRWDTQTLHPLGFLLPRCTLRQFDTPPSMWLVSGRAGLLLLPWKPIPVYTA